MAGDGVVRSSATVLVVDEDAEELRRFRKLLGREDTIAISADSGHAALALAGGEARLDAVLMDVALGDMDSADLCRKLKANPNTADVPIIAVCPPECEALPGRLARHVLGCVRKPVDGPALNAWLRTAREVGALRRQLARSAGEGVTCDREVLDLFAKLSHKVNNPLQALYATGDILALKMPEDSKQRELVEKIITYGQRVAEIVADASRQAKDQLGH